MNEKFDKNAKVEQLTKMFLGLGEEKGLIVKVPLSDSSVNFTALRDESLHVVTLQFCLKKMLTFQM